MSKQRPFMRRAIAVLTAAALSAPVLAAVATPASSALPAQAKTTSGYYRLLIGQLEVTALSDGSVTLPSINC